VEIVSAARAHINTLFVCGAGIPGDIRVKAFPIHAILYIYIYIFTYILHWVINDQWRVCAPLLPRDCLHPHDPRHRKRFNSLVDTHARIIEIYHSAIARLHDDVSDRSRRIDNIYKSIRNVYVCTCSICINRCI